MSKTFHHIPTRWMQNWTTHWLHRERELREESIRRGSKLWRRHKEKPPEFWWETFGILPDEIHLLE